MTGGPDFICLGAQKAGTRWLYDQLALHPDFWMPPIKELHVFDGRSGPKAHAEELLGRMNADLDRFNARRRKAGRRELADEDRQFLVAFRDLRLAPPDYAGYASLFASQLISGDITPGYSTLDDAQVAELIGHLPNARFLFIARDPIERMWSQICMDGAWGRGAPAVEAPTPDAVRELAGRDSVLSRSYQSDIVERWRKRLPPDRFGLFYFDDLVADASKLRREIIGFIGGDPAKAVDVAPDFNRKAGKTSRPLPDDVRSVLIDVLADEVRACAGTLGGPAQTWPGKYGL